MSCWFWTKPAMGEEGEGAGVVREAGEEEEEEEEAAPRSPVSPGRVRVGGGGDEDTRAAVRVSLCGGVSGDGGGAALSVLSAATGPNV